MTDNVRGIIFAMDHFAVHDGPGIRTVVYLKGCPLRCVWCHSPESQSGEAEILRMPDRCLKCDVCLLDKCPNQAMVACGQTVTSGALAQELGQNKVFFDASGGGVTLSGGEVLFQPEFARSLLENLCALGIHTLIETSGMGRWDNLRDISAFADLVYFDIKCLDDAKHLACTGAGDGIILGNLRRLAALRNACGITLRVPLIPGYNDSPEDIGEVYRLACELGLREVHLLRYNASAPAKYQWLSKPYLPGALNRQSNEYVEALCAIAPGDLNVTIV